MSMRGLVLAGLLCGWAAVVCGDDGPAGEAFAIPAQDGGADQWAWKGRFGAFLNSTATSNAATSRDTTINGTTSSTAYLLTLDTTLGWKQDTASVDNALKARYGEVRQRHADWVENNDEIRYDGVVRRVFSKPWFHYLGWGAESVFTGPAPDNHPFDPTVAHSGAGLGQLYADFLPDRNHLEWRLGVRAQRRWGNGVPSDQDGIETGPEAFLRYEHDMIETGAKAPHARFFAQYEAFAEFNDVVHVINLVTGGLAMQLSRYLTAELGVRAYYESRPKEYDGTQTGYAQWGIRQDTLVGLTCLF
jgi:hypothetical protein